MTRVRRFGCGLLLALCAFSAVAQDLLKVNSMNYPAWVVRNHQTLPLLPGSKLKANDLVRTGTRGRVLLQLADGSAVKLGESARFVIRSVQMSNSQSGSVLESTMQVLRGAFRFTSSFFETSTAGHRVDFRIGAITAGVRGTDIWGRSNPEQDLVCLIEGEIRVDARDEVAATLEQALSVYVKPQSAAALPVDQIDMQQLQIWAAETEFDPASGIVVENGEWQLVLFSLTDMGRAEQLIRSYHQQGFAVQRKSVERQGRTLHRLLLPGFVSIEAALAARNLVREQLGIDDAWVWKAGRV